MTVTRKMVPINLIEHYPKIKVGEDELARHVSDVHASAVIQRLEVLNCPTQHKLDLFDAVKETGRYYTMTKYKHKGSTIFLVLPLNSLHNYVTYFSFSYHSTSQRQLTKSSTN